MKYIDFNTICSLNISVDECLNWARQVLLYKYTAILPPKISIKFDDNCFFNTMPSLLPSIKRFGVKIVSRYPKESPALSADILLYDSTNGKLIAIMDGTWITAMRTGAIAALSIDLLKKKETASYSFVGLGNTARATLLCLNSTLNDKPIVIKILAYKNQHIDFMQRFSTYENITFVVYDSITELIKSSDVIVSCVTSVNDNFADDNVYPEGILVVPVHTMGFQNCDLFFDKIFCDDIGHISNFKCFKKFKNCEEIADVVSNKRIGREMAKERILVYNIGVSLQDIFFASNIYDNIISQGVSLIQSRPSKFWV